jgi:hypothetical protein
MGVSGRALTPGKGPPVPIVQEAGWAPETVWTLEAIGKISRLFRGSKHDRPVSCQTPYRLSYPAHIQHNQYSWTDDLEAIKTVQ